MKKLKSTLYPLLIGALLLGLIGLGLGLFQFTVSVEPQSPEGDSFPKTQSSDAPADEGIEELPSALPSVPAPSTVPVASPTQSPDPKAVAAHQGALRVGNPTEHPIRIALLARAQSKGTSEPAHWDFAPGEGGSQGLILSLPRGDLKLSKGDILVAFAQDGSRQYWGPYVVGETPAPVWRPQTAEWQLVLQP